MFIYSLCGWDGSVADAALWRDAISNDIEMPADRYFLGDSGFPSCDALLVPYRGVRYHLREWREGRIGYVFRYRGYMQTNTTRPRNARELFNIRHAALRNVIERIFGVIKRRWRVLALPPKYDMHIQARIPAGLCALHNFINGFDEEIFNAPDFDWTTMRFNERDDIPLAGNDDEEPVEPAVGEEMVRANRRQDEIARLMWVDYLAECAQRGIVLPA